MTDGLKNCVDCKWLASQDEGYSDYTVESSEYICLKYLNPHLPAETSLDSERERESVAMRFGENCDSFKEPVTLNDKWGPYKLTIGVYVEGGWSIDPERLKQGDPELYEAAVAYFGDPKWEEK